MIDTHFTNGSGMRLTAEQVMGEVKTYMKVRPSSTYKITIGTDSSLLLDKNADFVTAIVVHRIGNGGRYFWRRGKLGTFHTLRDRIIQEVLLSLEIAQDVLELLKAEGEELPRWTFEIHVDVGTEGPTSVMLQEVIGLVRAHNFEALTKPQSYAASAVADRHV